MSYLKEHDICNRQLWASFNYLEVKSWLGTLAITQCDTCDYLIVFCPHEITTWNATGTILVCNLCGIEEGEENENKT